MSSLKYADEHSCCYNYEGDVNSTIQLLQVDDDPNYHYKVSTLQHKIFYVAKGCCELTYNHKSYKVEEHKLFMIVAGSEADIHIKNNGLTNIFILRVTDIEHLCRNYSLDMLLKEESDESEQNEDTYILSGNDVIKDFFELLKCTYTDGMRCRFFLESKVIEFLYLLRAYYYKEELLNFFYAILSNDISFSEFVIKNHYKARTVNDLADMANYSLSGFQKRFKKVFGTSAYHWMKREKLKSIYDEISNSSSSLKELSSKYDFSSPSHFNDFCKRNFGHTPGVLRKNKINIKIVSIETDED